MLGVGKAAPAQFVLRGISAAGQKAGFAAYPSHWPSIWCDVIGGQCIFFANTRRIAASFVSLATSFFVCKKLIVCSRRCSSLPNRTRLRWASIWGKRALLKSASFLSTYTAITRSEPVSMGDRFGFLRSLRNGIYPFGAVWDMGPVSQRIQKDSNRTGSINIFAPTK